MQYATYILQSKGKHVTTIQGKYIFENKEKKNVLLLNWIKK